MMRTHQALTVLAGVALALAAFETPAEACGGCVAPENAFTAVDEHRMVIALGPDQTILWDQFIYSGEPEEFAWVLPVPSEDAVVEVADPEFVTVLDRDTSPIVSPADTSCGGADSQTSGGCAGPGGGVVAVAPPTDGVEVYSQGVAGPYETVVLGADDPQNLYNWLSLNGYAFPASGTPILDHYIAKESAFVVLRLRPDVGVSAMQPVRVRFKGFMGEFPLRMVALGAQQSLELSLWVVAEQRYAPMNYGNAVVDGADLTWDWDAGTSDYDDVFARTIEEAGGRVWITEYAGALEGSALRASLAEEAPAELAVLDAIHYPYVTRLRSEMLVDYLNEDLSLAPAEDSSDRAREILAERATGGLCDESATAGAVRRGGAPHQLAFLLAAVLCAIHLGGRVRLLRRRTA